MNSKENILSEEESRWVACLNGEPDITDSCDLDESEKAEFIRVWEMTGTNLSYRGADPDKGWSQLQEKIGKSNRIVKVSFFKSGFLKYAAMLVLVLGIGLAALQLFRKSNIDEDLPPRMATAQTEAHPLNVLRISLPDGSSVTLNANTKIEYPECFAGKVRKIKLSGEAFFDVTKDSLHPFRIETPNASVEVLGTSFNVSAYPNTDNVEVNVEAGKVRLSQHNEGSKDLKFVVLPAGNRGWLRISKQEIGRAELLEPNYASWITKAVNFQRTPLAEVLAVLENTYHVRFILENQEIGKIPYTANFADANLDYIVRVIARTHHLQVKRNGDDIILARVAK